jgi:hypothetical protein
MPRREICVAAVIGSAETKIRIEEMLWLNIRVKAEPCPRDGSRKELSRTTLFVRRITEVVQTNQQKVKRKL